MPSPIVLSLSVAPAAYAARDPSPPPPPPPPAPITFTAEDASAERQTTLETGPRVSGTLEARERAIVRAEVGGQVVAAGPELGEPVTKGALLVRVEVKSLGDGVRSAQAGVASAEAAYEVAKKEAERIAENFDVFDFELSATHMDALNALDEGTRFRPGSWM